MRAFLLGCSVTASWRSSEAAGGDERILAPTGRADRDIAVTDHAAPVRGLTDQIRSLRGWTPSAWHHPRR